MLLDTPICDFGWRAPDFTLEQAGGGTVALQSAVGPNGLLIAFICNHCPYVKAIADRFSADAKTLRAEGVNVLAIMSNDYISYPADSPEEMVKFAAKHGFEFPYLVDENQTVGRAYDAVCTPDFFGFNRGLELQYRGRLDDLRMNESKDRVPELLNAMRQVADTGQGPKEQTPSMGCSIKWR
ncbi:MAG: thioredoxin family protein [Pseudomonadota bacterium]